MSARQSNLRKKYTSRSLLKAAVLCPACGAQNDLDADSCHSCNFTQDVTNSTFRSYAPVLADVSDFVGLCNQSQRNKIQKYIDSIQNKFPQIHWKVVIADIPQQTNQNLCAFWLLNSSPYAETEEPEDRDWTVLLVFSPDGQAVLTMGYCAEAWLSHQKWSDSVKAFYKTFKRKGHIPAVAGFFKTAELLLEKSWLRMRSLRKHRSGSTK